jgi:hypothetical protein
VVCAVLNDSASDPYRQESNGDKKTVTYFNPDIWQQVVPMLKLVVRNDDVINDDVEACSCGS